MPEEAKERGASSRTAATASAPQDDSSRPSPCDLQAERSVLAAILTEPSCITSAMSVFGSLAAADTTPHSKKSAKTPKKLSEDYFRRLAATMFREPKHAAVYEAMLNLHAKDSAIDILSVSDWLTRSGHLDAIGGQQTLLDIHDSITTTAHIESWCQILRDYAMLREMIRACSSALDTCRSGGQNDVKELLDAVESRIYSVRNSFEQPEIKELRELVEGTFQHFLDIMNKKVEPGIPTGFSDLDRLVAGLKPGEMFVLAARPSVGKTALALNIIRNIVMKGGGKERSAAFFSLEMSADQITQRLICTEAKIPLSSIIEGSFKHHDMPKLTKAVATLKNAELYIDPTGGISILELRAKARKLKEKFNIALIVVDYLQLMRAGDKEMESRQVEVSIISGGLKKLAKDLNIPVLVLAQLNREVEKGQSAKALPKLSHLRESGSIEQDADVVVFLHRNRDDSKESGESSARGGVDAKLIVEKNRNGKTGIVDLKFHPMTMEFKCVEHRYDEDDLPDKPKA